MLTKSCYIISRLSDDKCLDVYGSNVDDETNIQLYTLGHSKPNQRWKLIPAEGEYYYIVSGLPNSKCLDVYGSNAIDGTNIQLFTLHRKPNQQWKLIPAEGEYYHIVSGLPNSKCLDIYDSNTDPDDETNIQLNTLRLGEPSQQWKLMPTGE